MTSFTLNIDVNAPSQRCFDLARSMDFHIYSMQATGERIVAGRAAGLIALHEEVEFEARHLGLTRRLRARVTHFDPPRTFTDEQTRGPFRSLTHRHTFEARPDGATRMTDQLSFDLGLSLAGVAAERLAVGPHLRRLIARHQQNLKLALESDDWPRFL